MHKKNELKIKINFFNPQIEKIKIKEN